MAIVWSSDAEVYVWGDSGLVDDLDVKRSLWGTVWSDDPAMFFRSPVHEDDVLIRVTPRRAMTMAFSDQGLVQARWRA